MSQKKVWFSNNYYQLSNNINNRVLPMKIVELLKDQHDLNLVTVKTFKSYLYRYKSESRYV